MHARALRVDVSSRGSAPGASYQLPNRSDSGDTLPCVAVLLGRRWANLLPGERARVDAAWPAKARTETAAGRVREPDRGRLLEWELETDADADAEATPARREASVQMDLVFMNAWLPASWKRYGPRRA